MSAAAAPIKPLRRKLRCPDCGTKDDFPASFTQKNVPDYCDVCRFHFNHECAHDLRCAVCTARLWLARLRALRILLFSRTLLQPEDAR